MIVIVCGMHRSGTSAMAGMLHMNGISMGREKDFYPPPMKENPKGFYENVRFRRINDLILSKVGGYRVKSFNPDIPKIKKVEDETITSRMNILIDDYQVNNEDWGWKDPRTNLTILSWIDIFERMLIRNQVKIITMLRSHEEVANSMKARGNKESEEGQFNKLSEAYYERLVNTYGDYYTEQARLGLEPIPMMYVNFKSLIDNTRKEAARVSAFLNKSISDTSFVDPVIAQNVA